MTKKYKIALALLGFGVIISVIAAVAYGTNVAVLNPKGSIAAQQRDLMIIVTLLMLIVVVPVFIMTFTFAWKYRASNTKSNYRPNWDHNTKLESIWWGIPLVIITILSAIIWFTSHSLDPYKPLTSDKQPIEVQVVALQWKWLFIYPQEGIASVNYVQFPTSTPVNFKITADAPMNSFWIPQLGGQVYAMSGMSTKLHLIADEPGSYQGVSANLSGEGFAGMKFEAKATSQTEFDNWVAAVKAGSPRLSQSEYETLAKPSKDNPAAYYVSDSHNLYDTIVMKYMMPEHDASSSEHAGHSAAGTTHDEHNSGETDR